MTAKDKVLAIYENAHIWVMNDRSEWPRFYVQYWHSTSKFHYLARRMKTENEAWEEAWETIQENMINKLET